MATRKKSTGLHWELSGPCPTCAAPVFFAFKGKEIYVRRTCYHNTSPQYSGSQPYTVWSNTSYQLSSGGLSGPTTTTDYSDGSRISLTDGTTGVNLKPILKAASNG